MNALATTVDSPTNATGAPVGETSQASRALSMSSNFTWTLVGNGCFAACQWANLVVLAKLGGPIAVGQFALGLAVTAPIFLFLNLQLRSVQATDTSQRFEFGHYLGLRLLTISAAMLLVGLLVTLSAYSAEACGVILLIALGKCFDSASDVACGLAQQRERLDRIARARMLAGIGSLTGLGLGVWLSGSVVWGAFGWAMGYGLVTILCRYWLGRDVLVTVLLRRGDTGSDQNPWRALRPIFAFPTLWLLWKTAFPLGLVAMLISLNTNVPRYFIENELGEAALGIFAGMAYLILATTLVCLALGESAMPRLSKYFAAGDLKAFRRVLGRLLLMAIGGGVVTVLAAATIGPFALELVYSAEFAQFPTVLVCLAIVAGLEFASSFLGVAVMATRRFYIQAPLYVMVFATTLVACTVLIPQMGLMGAAIAMGTGAVCRLVGTSLILLLALHQQRSALS